MKQAIFCFLGVVILSCERPLHQPTPWEPTSVPEYIDEQIIPDRNPTTVEGIALGRKLFFDEGLSADGQVSCMSCHRPGMAFTDGLAITQMGVSGKALVRNSPTLMNVGWLAPYFWDGGSPDLESQAYGPLQHPDEMGVNLDSLEAYLRSHEEYPALFQQAFGPDASIDNVEVVRALAQFQRSLVGFNAPWDRYQQGDSTALHDIALQGWQLFEEHCATCHTPPLFTDNQFHNNGLDVQFPEGLEGVFQGRYRISGDSADMGAFKTPTLRNISDTDPYMHDGRMESLEEVLFHYTQGMVASPTLDTLLENEGVIGISLTKEEQHALLTFLREGLLEDY